MEKWLVSLKITFLASAYTKFLQERNAYEVQMYNMQEEIWNDWLLEKYEPQR